MQPKTLNYECDFHVNPRGFGTCANKQDNKFAKIINFLVGVGHHHIKPVECFSRGSNTEYTCYNIPKYPFMKIIENERIILRTLLVFFLYLYILAYFVVLAVIVFKYYLITQKDFLYKHIK